MDDWKPINHELIAAFEREQSLPDGFLNEMHQEDDWSFIVKLHALIEAGVTQILINHFGDTRLDDTFASMALGGRHGKLSLVKTLALLPDYNIAFVRRLNDIRNTVVHKISNVTFNISTYIAELKPGERTKLATEMGDGLIPVDFISDGPFCETPYEELQQKQLLKEPRASFALSALVLLTNICKSKERERLMREIKELERRAGKTAMGRKD
jgi:hypothetical protein